MGMHALCVRDRGATGISSCVHDQYHAPLKLPVGARRLLCHSIDDASHMRKNCVHFIMSTGTR